MGRDRGAARSPTRVTIRVALQSPSREIPDMKRIALTVVLLFMLVGRAWAGEAEGWDAYERRDYATALKEFLPLADQGDAEAQFNLGVMYEIGNGVPQDFAEAAKWYRKAAEQGIAAAQSILGVMYHAGDGVPLDYVEAVKWHRMAAEQGYARAQLQIGLMYRHGIGVPLDYVQAHIWFNLAAAQGNELGRKYRDIVAKKMTPAQISKAQAMAREWLENHP